MALKSTNKHRRNSALHWFWKKIPCSFTVCYPNPIAFSRRANAARVLLTNSSLLDFLHYDDVIMGAMASQINSLTVAYSTVYSGADQRKHISSVSLASVWRIHQGPVNSPHKWPVTRKMFAFDDVIMLELETNDKNNSNCNAFFAESLEARCQVENEDVVGAAPTGDAPTTSEWFPQWFSLYSPCDICRHSFAVVILTKYGCDLNGSFSQWLISLTQNTKNEALITPLQGSILL